MSFTHRRERGLFRQATNDARFARVIIFNQEAFKSAPVDSPSGLPSLEPVVRSSNVTHSQIKWSRKVAFVSCMARRRMPATDQGVDAEEEEEEEREGGNRQEFTTPQAMDSKH